MQLGNNTGAATTIERAIAANDKAGRSGKNAALLEMLYSAYAKTNNDAKRMQTLQSLDRGCAEGKHVQIPGQFL